MMDHVLINKPALHFISIITSALRTQKPFRKAVGFVALRRKDTEKNTMKERLYIHIYIYIPTLQHLLSRNTIFGNQ